MSSTRGFVHEIFGLWRQNAKEVATVRTQFSLERESLCGGYDSQISSLQTWMLPEPGMSLLANFR